MFLGQFYHNLDAKGRLTVPARFRDDLAAEPCVLMQGFDQNLMLMTYSHFQQLSRRVKGTTITDPTSRLLRRLLYSTAHDVELDRSGRILVPPFLREAIGLDSEAVIIGTGDFIEIWTSDLWLDQAQELADAQVNAHRFSELDLSTE